MKYFTILLQLFSISVFAQSDIIYKGEHINALDVADHKTGIWKAYNDEKNIVITCEYKDDKPVTETKYYKDSRLIATFDNIETFTIYWGGTIKANLRTKKDYTIVLASPEGKELDKSIQDFFKENCQISPMYYGGAESLYHYINTNINKKKAKNIRGRLTIRFIVDAAGYYESAEVTESLEPGLDADVIRVLKNMARWQPGHHYGRFERGTYRIPVTFK